MFHKLTQARVIRAKEGFTIIELLIVIVIIGILATLSINYLSAVQQSALASRYVTTAQTIEKGFIAKAIADGRTEWWHENEALPELSTTIEACAGTYGSSPRIPGMVANCGFGDFIPGDLEGIGLFSYDADSNASQYISGCAVDDGTGWIDVTKGVNILIKDDVTQDIFDRMDETVDGGDGPYCGTMRYWADRGNAYYSIDLFRSDAGNRF